jgi:hypothetical protein
MLHRLTIASEVLSFSLDSWDRFHSVAAVCDRRALNSFDDLRRSQTSQTAATEESVSFGGRHVVARATALRFFLLLVMGSFGTIFASDSDLEKGFRNPPDSARPWVYSFWLNGNITSNGITADLEAMKRVGIGGLLIMDVDQGTPKGPVSFGSPQWRNLFKHLCAEAHRLGLQVNMNNDPGWCGSGGPWVTPELSMQKVVWTETTIKGPSHCEASLARPEAFQKFYHDIAVLAFPTLDGDEIRMADFKPKFTVSGSDLALDPKMFLDGDPKTKITLPQPGPGQPQFLQIEFAQPFTARQMVLDMGLTNDQIYHGTLQYSEDGSAFKKVSDFAAEELPLHLNFHEVTARYFRLLFKRASPDLKELTIADIDLSPRMRIDHIDAKAMFVRKNQYPGPNDFPGQAAYPPVANGLAIKRGQVIDLTDRIDRTGKLGWDAPPGSWTVIRIGHTSNGTDNHPAPEGGHGLECDKLSKAGVETVFNAFIRELARDTKAVAPGALVSTHIDSWEVGSQNWTEDFRAEFTRRRGYDPLLFLPTMTGRVVDSLEISERFLWDLRQTISDLLVDNYAGHLRELAQHQGLRLSIEAYDGNPCEDLVYAGKADEPMAEFWILPPYEMDYSCGEMASAAHVYGKPIVGAEAFTATEAEKWLYHPYAVKGYGDWAFCEGINRFVVHRYAQQPWTDPERAPGISMGPFGLHYERTQTWWKQSRAWHEYLARCQYMLRQGRFVADICYVAPERSPQHWKTPLRARERIGYDFDVCPAEAVLQRMTVRKGRITLPDGMSYRVLVLPESETMTPELLSKVRDLVRAGATVIGSRPFKSPSLSNYPVCDAEVKRLSDELWGSGDGRNEPERRLGKGRVVCAKPPREVLAEAGVPPDFEPEPSGRDALRYIHRQVAGTEVYFIANTSTQPQQSTCAFRVRDRRPELWWPDAGRVDAFAVYGRAGNVTRVPLRLEAFGSVFVVFRSGARAEADRIVSITRNGCPLIDGKLEAGEAFGATCPDGTAKSASSSQVSAPIRSVPDGTNTFTMAVWVRPESDIALPEEANFGKSAYAVEQNDALYPPAGHDVYRSPEHAGVGLSVGRNGTCVFEHTADYFAPILVFGASLTNWTHVAVVYREGRPSLYLNGRLVHEGMQSTFTVHSGVGVQHRRRAAPFQGALGEFVNLHRALNEAEIAGLMKTMPLPATPPKADVEFLRTAKGQLQAEAWLPGVYEARNARGKSWRFETQDLPKSLEITGPWEVSFPPHWGAPRQLKLSQLMSWSDYPDQGVRYFSGTAAYAKSFTVPDVWIKPQQQVYLDLGRVAVIAEVELNGVPLGTLWKPPFRLPITNALKPGDNQLQVRVVNLWVNRMIGDEQLPEDSERNPKGTLKDWPQWLKNGQPSPTGRYTFTTWQLWKKDSPLQESGLLGPVKLIATREIPLR